MELLLSTVLAQYDGPVVVVLNNVYDASDAVVSSNTTPYLDLVNGHARANTLLILWLLAPEVRGLAMVRSEIVRRTAGHAGGVVIMDGRREEICPHDKDFDGGLGGRGAQLL